MTTTGTANEPRLRHQQHVDADHRRAEGQPEIAEHVERDLPLALAGEIDGEARRHAPGDAAAVGEERPLVDRPRIVRRPSSRCRRVRRRAGCRAGVRSVGQHVDHHVGRRPAGGLGKHVGHALEILVVDHLVDAGRLPSAQFGQRNQLAAAALDLHLRQVGRAGPPLDGHPQLDPQRIALGVAPHHADRAALQHRLKRGGDLLGGDAAQGGLLLVGDEGRASAAAASRTSSTSTTPGSTASRARTVSAASSRSS